MAIPNAPSTQNNPSDPNPANGSGSDVNRIVPGSAPATTPNVNPPTMPAETMPGADAAPTVPPSPSVPGTNDTMTEMDTPSISAAQSVAPDAPVAPSLMDEPTKMNTAPVEPNVEMNTLPPLSNPTETTEPGMPEAPASPAPTEMKEDKPAMEEKHETIAHTGVLDQFSSPADAGATNPSPEAPTPAPSLDDKPVEAPSDNPSGASKILPFVVLIAAFIALLTLLYYFFL